MVKPTSILMIEDSAEECAEFMDCIKKRKDFELVYITDSDIDGLEKTKLKRPDAVILDIELNESLSGNMESSGFLIKLNELNPNYKPIIIVATHVKKRRTWNKYHKNGADMILYKDHTSFSWDYVLNTINSLKEDITESPLENLKTIIKDNEERISEYLSSQLDMIGISAKLKGRAYLYDAVMYLVENRDTPDSTNVFQHLMKTHKRSDKTISNGMRTAILHAWNKTSYEDLSELYTARIDPETLYPTPTEFVYYYVDKIKRML